MWQLLLAAVAGLAIAIIVIKFLNLDRIIDWFRGRNTLTQADHNNLAFTVRESLSNGHFGIVQGVFDQGSGEVLEVTKYDAQDVCDDLKYGDQILVYN